MAKERAKRKTAGAGGIVLGLGLALVLAALVLCGVWLWAGARPGPADLRPERDVSPVRLELYEPGEPLSGEAPVPAAAPELTAVEAAEPYGFAEILGEEEGLLVARIQGKRYKGFIAIIDDPLRLYVATCPYFSEDARGLTVKQMADDTGAVLAINGGGFADDGGVGTGGMPIGNVVANGQMLWAGGGSTVGMDYDGVLHVGEFSGNACRDMGLLWAVAYGPTLVEDGQIRSGLNNTLEEPRTAVGQRADGAVVLLNIQGRQASALGVTCQELAEIMVGYGCVNAGNLDGGASSDMYYRGEYINICNTSGGPRPIPTAVMVAPAGTKEE